MLATLSTNKLLLGCTPVVNLFRTKGDPIRLTHTSASYPVLADARRAFAYEAQAIDSVSLVRQTPQGETIIAYQPFYSLKHALFTGVTLEYEMALVPCAADVREVAMKEGSAIGRLGWDADLVEGTQAQDRRDLRDGLHAL